MNEHTYAASIIWEGKTDERYGFLQREWDERQFTNIELYELDASTYRVSKVEEYVQLKAPWGKWRTFDQSGDVLRSLSDQAPYTGLIIPVQ
ncbi:MAG: hypothetical protein OXI74_16320 [Rhodospirillaceae bacterium]|nr:hypothetical protein [Rhodospirillaceae bacterium]